ncbi:MAG: ATP-binding cassette domain-containing protein [Spirochaeta sp.]|jgi:ATP-binding cassette subfamily F protein uup|nr:ATP-binding cassette domain-containing protein [Spirochaeta sp.]
MALITLQNITLSHGGPNLLENVSLSLEPGDRLCLVGRNGAGKSTLLRVIAGLDPPDSGTRGLDGATRIAYLRQESAAGAGGTARSLAGTTDGTPAVDPVATERYLTRLGVDPEQETAEMSGGELRRAMLAAALAMEADVLLLDEPTNHLDIETVLWLEEHLLRSHAASIALIFVTHDRAFARRVANRVGELDRGALHVFSGGYDAFIERRNAQLAAEEQQRKAFDRTLAAEEAWIRRGTRARRTRDEGRVRALEQMREEYRLRRSRAGSAQFGIAEAARSGDIVVETEELTVKWAPEDAPLITDLTTTVFRGDRLGVIGPNGAGKTTLLRTLLDETFGSDETPTPDTGAGGPIRNGRIRRGSGVEAIYFDQLREQLTPTDTLFQAFGDGYETVTVNGARRHVTAYMRDFLFDETDMNRPVATLSGGERNRLLLARLFARKSNLIVLDEPTNDLDAETLELLEERLIAYRGTVLLVSHDREFLDNIVAGCLVLGGDGRVEESPGGYSDWRRRQDTTRAAGQTAAKDAAPAPGTATAPDRPTERVRKLTFNEKRELHELPDRIEALEAELERIHARLADPELYRQAGDGSGNDPAALTTRLETLGEDIATALHRWEELETIRENETTRL